ncbi:MAG: hypothetical protein AB1454_05820 [Candidatus Auribacterota bacterium]
MKARIALITIFVIFCSAALSFAQSEPDQDTMVPFEPGNEAVPIAGGTDTAGSAVDTLLASVNKDDALITVTTSLSKGLITIGDPIVYRIEVRSAENINIEFPDFGDEVGGLIITDYKQEGPIKDKKQTVWRREYTLDVFLTGTYSIPPAKIAYKLDQGDAKQLLTAPLFVTVESIITDDNAALKEIKPPIIPSYAMNRKMTALITGAALGLVGILIGLAIWIRRKKAYVPPPVPPHIIALEALKKLKNQGLIEAGKVKEYYFHVSLILRRYIENRFGLMAPERTTEEFLIDLQKTTVLNVDQKKALAQFLTHCDMVKFARYEPAQEEINAIYDTAVSFVEQTKPLEAEPEEEYYEEDED